MGTLTSVFITVKAWDQRSYCKIMCRDHEVTSSRFLLFTQVDPYSRWMQYQLFQADPRLPHAAAALLLTCVANSPARSAFGCVLGQQVVCGTRRPPAVTQFTLAVRLHLRGASRLNVSFKTQFSVSISAFHPRPSLLHRFLISQTTGCADCQNLCALEGIGMNA